MGVQKRFLVSRLFPRNVIFNFLSVWNHLLVNLKCKWHADREQMQSIKYRQMHQNMSKKSFAQNVNVRFSTVAPQSKVIFKMAVIKMLEITLITNFGRELSRFLSGPVKKTSLYVSLMDMKLCQFEQSHNACWMLWELTRFLLICQHFWMTQYSCFF